MQSRNEIASDKRISQHLSNFPPENDHGVTSELPTIRQQTESSEVLSAIAICQQLRKRREHNLLSDQVNGAVCEVVRENEQSDYIDAEADAGSQWRSFR